MRRVMLALALGACSAGAAQGQTAVFAPNGMPTYSPYRPGGLPTGIVPGSTPYQALPIGGTAPPGVVLPGQSYLRTSPSDPFGLGNGTNRDFQVATPQPTIDQSRGPSGQPTQAPPIAPPVPVQATVRTGATVDPRGLVTEGNAIVVDGDTLTIGGRHVTLFGADAPEVGQVCTAGATGWRCGEKARERLASLADGRSLRCVGEIQAGDAVSSVCTTVDGVDLGLTLVTEGLAVVPKAVTTRYLAAQSEARVARRGVWIGSFEAPWDYRRKIAGRGSLRVGDR
ncbi:hypothetical protein BHAOGJBA_2968 [Methylobacterium hispanicum]|uniref:TNase-like domain-containing protein n=1 Tax=Methylobacterium hispanicum TaxID=270350 RepID=A0AAV4ZNL2_9HYPH|nr:thermonuclease family protein [Methylobacterium hispanicum]GJD89441.1 hypothetical protein BHAOGJBA_2968 [Methylobacterium hispanicum]